MALINCPNCGNQMSDAAPACPHCGRPNTPASSGAAETPAGDPSSTYGGGQQGGYGGQPQGGYGPPPGGGQGAYGPPPGGGYGQQPPRGPRPDIPNYLVQAILATICCCIPLGIPAIIYASQVNTKLAAGDIAGAQAASANAKKWSLIALVGGVVFGILYAIFNAAILASLGSGASSY